MSVAEHLCCPTGRFHPLVSAFAAVIASLTCALTHGQPVGLTESPFLPESVPTGSTLFSEVPAAASGIQAENPYDDPEMWGKRYHEFEIGAIGTGVAIGDYDSDGKPDVFVVSKTQTSRLFRNLGAWKFKDVTEESGLAQNAEAARAWKQGATFADINNDGRLDLYVCRFAAPNLLYVNQGDGTFKEQAKAAGLDVNDATTMASFCDYDRDGWLDVYVQTNLLNNAERPSGQPDYLFRNNRDGTFTDVSVAAGLIRQSTQGNSATWWDYNNDSWPDLYVANDFAAPDFLYRNNRDGTFTNVADQTIPHMTYSSMGSDVGDVNNDGLIDFMVADMAATTHEKDQRTMADTRARTRDPAEDSTAAPNYLRNALYLNTGTSRCLEAAYLTDLDATDWTWSLRFEDLDNDGRVDLHITNGMHREIHNTDLILRMMTAESAFERVRIARTSPVLNEPNLVYRNLGDLKFDQVGAAWGLNHKGVSFGAAFGDLDGDGDLDLVYTNFEAGVTALRNDTQGHHRAVIELKGTQSNRFGLGAVVTVETKSGKQIRQLGAARGYMSSSEPVVHFGLGADTVIDELVVSWPSGHKQTFQNVSADRRLTITEPNSAPPDRAPPENTATQFTDVTRAANLSVLSREEPVDEIAQQRFLPMRLNRRGPAIAVGRLNATEHETIFLGGTTASPITVVRPDGPSRFATEELRVSSSSSPVNDGPLLVLDANADGFNDLLVTRGGASLPSYSPEYQPVLLLNDGQGSLRPAEGALPPLHISVGAAAAADFNRDGRLDLFIGARVSPGEYPFAPSSALLVNQGGRYDDVTESVAPEFQNLGMVTAALWSDVDGDTWPDLVVTLEWGTIKYLRNREGRGFEDRTEASGIGSAGTGWWTSLASADFNRDGKPDFAVGNVGLNTPYHADSEHPSLLLWGDFKEGGSPLLIEGYYEGDTLYPRRTRRELGAAIPALLKRIPKNDSYAKAGLADILGAQKIAAADRFSATELRSGVLLSRPDGTYGFQAFPRIVQISPIQGMIAGDVDGDGAADVYAVQNSYAPNPVVGRFDGGLSQLLRGDGKGSFDPVPIAQSGLLVPGDAKALSRIDLNLDGWPDFMVSRNQSSTLAFQNTPQTGRQSVRVVLRGATNNPDAVGAKISALYRDGAVDSAEIFAGSGYYSQSSAACFFGYTDANPIREFQVRWPSGESSAHKVSALERSLTISEAQK